jgi:hypothetical protein
LHFQVSGLYFYADNGYSTTYPGVDVRLIGSTLGRLNSDGTLIPRNSFKNDPTKRVDARIQRHFTLGHRMGADVLVEGFNLFNSATYNYTLNQASRGFGKIATDNQVANAAIGVPVRVLASSSHTALPPCLCGEMKLQERQHLFNNVARGSAVVEQIERVRP